MPQLSRHSLVQKNFTLPADGAMIYFEAVMGKQKIYVNGKLATTHFGGYLPIIVRLDKMGLHKGDKCVIAVMTDNSDDGSYPPGKPQTQLDFAYHGGIYRDVWLIARHKVHITDANEAGKTAGGGVFVHFSNISAQRADVSVNTDIINESAQTRVVTVEQQLLDAAGHVVRWLTKAEDTAWSNSSKHTNAESEQAQPMVARRALSVQACHTRQRAGQDLRRRSNTRGYSQL